MFKKLIIESFILHQDLSDIFEAHNAKNYMWIQRMYIFPNIAKEYGYDDFEEFVKADQAKVVEVSSLFREVVIEMFGTDETGKPNSDVTDDPHWDVTSPEAEKLANEILSRIKSKMLIPAE